MLWRLIELLFLVFLVIFLFSQVVIPPLLNKPFFWLFRKSERELAHKKEKVSELHTKIETQSVEQEIENLEKKLE